MQYTLLLGQLKIKHTHVSSLEDLLALIACTMKSSFTTPNTLGIPLLILLFQRTNTITFNSTVVHCGPPPLHYTTHPLLVFLSRYQDLWPKKPSYRYPNYHFLCIQRKVYKYHSQAHLAKSFPSPIVVIGYLLKKNLFLPLVNYLVKHDPLGGHAEALNLYFSI